MLRPFLSTLIRLYGHHVPLAKGKYRLALWAYEHLRPITGPAVVRLGTRFVIEVDPNEFVQSQIYYLGYYELYLAQFFCQLVQPHTVFADVGAHVGQYTLLAAAYGAEVHAFEPNPQNLARLTGESEP